MRRLPPVPGPTVVSARLARHYDALLHHPGLSARDRALLLALAHGLTPTQAVRLRVDDVDAAARLLRVTGPRQRVRLLPFSDRAADVLGTWARQQARLGAVWLFDHGPRARDGVRPLLGRPAISTSLVREVVRQAAAHVFPLASQRGIRRRLRAGGLADVFHTRLVSSRLPLHLVVELLGVDRISHLRRYGRPVTLARLHREWRRLTARRRWI